MVGGGHFFLFYQYCCCRNPILYISEALSSEREGEREGERAGRVWYCCALNCTVPVQAGGKARGGGDGGHDIVQEPERSLRQQFLGQPRFLKQPPQLKSEQYVVVRGRQEVKSEAVLHNRIIDTSRCAMNTGRGRGMRETNKRNKVGCTSSLAHTWCDAACCTCGVGCGLVRKPLKMAVESQLGS